MRLTFILILISIINVFPQLRPSTYLIGEEIILQKQSSSENPASNSISDIISIGDTVWLGTSRGVSVSFNRGESWTNFYGTEAFGTQSISAIAYHNGIFFSATARAVEVTGGQTLPEGTGLKITTDLGQTWISVPQPLDDQNDTTLVYGINDGVRAPLVRALPVTVAVQNLAYDIAINSGYVFISTFAGGLRKAPVDSLIANPNYKWQRVLLPSDKVNSISPDDTIKFALQPVAGRFGPDNNLNHRVFSVVSADDSTLYVGTAGGINKSTDGGISWVKFNHQNQDEPISGNFVVALAYDFISKNIWAATWKAEALTEFYAVSVSENGGVSWQTSLIDERAHNFGFKLTFNTSQVIAACDNGPFRSRNMGLSWILPGPIVDSKSNLTLPTSVFYSAAASGNTVWLGSVNGLAKLDETGLMWTGTWKLYIASPPLAAAYESYAFPNPFSPRLDVVKIKYSTGGKNSKVTIRIFDFGMNLVRTVIQNAERGAPTHVVDGQLSGTSGVIDFWDGRDESGSIVSNGVYFYRIDVDSDNPLFGKILVLQ